MIDASTLIAQSLNAALGQTQSQLQGNYIGNLGGPLQQSPNQLAQYQQNSLYGLQCLNALTASANAITAPTPPSAYLRVRARSYAEEGERLIERIDFWTQLMPFSAPIVSKLTDKLEYAADECERFLDMAE